MQIILVYLRQALSEGVNDAATVTSAPLVHSDDSAPFVHSNTSGAAEETDLDVHSSAGLTFGNHQCGVHHRCCCCKTKVDFLPN